jgi:hypothetical protein
MTTLISVTRNWQLEALLEIENLEFLHWYELGVWWALYGEEQGKGQYDDQYLIVNLTSHIKAGWYTELTSGLFPMFGFELGMIHGGMIDPITHELRSSASLVNLTDPDFTNGYSVGREYYFFEATAEEKSSTDTWLMGVIHEWALGYPTWREPDETLRYSLGCRIGALSSALFPLGEQERAQIEAKNRLALMDRMLPAQAL